MTSVKEFRVSEPATADELGRGRFVFTDAYSVFDWGRMPDPIPRKGASLCTMGAYNFELLEAAGVPTHYRGVVDPETVDPETVDPETVDPETVDPETVESGADREDAVVPLDEAAAPPTEMAIALTRVPDLPYVGSSAGYDYDAFHAAGEGNYLVPLEVVFRNTVPVGSSLRSRFGPAEVGIDRDEWPNETIGLPEPIVEFSTKYEQQDRYLTYEEADRIAGVADIDALADLALSVNRVVTDRAEGAGFVHEDGKIECMYINGELRVADVVGTFDENRFSYDGQQVSKEVVRQWYRRNDPEWVAAVGEAKEAVADRDVADWRGLCGPDPIELPDDVLETISTMYAAGTNAYTGDTWFDAPSIGAAIGAVRGL